MNINLDDYEENNLSQKDEMILRKYFIDTHKYNSFDDALDVNKYDLDEVKAVSENRKNIISWYEGFAGKTVLELGSNFGEITGELLRNANRVVAVEQNKEKAEAIFRRYENEENIDNLELKVCDILKLELKEKFDYVLLIGSVDTSKNFDKYMKIAEKHLAENGKILLAFNNKFGLRYFSGVKDVLNKSFEEITGVQDDMLTKKQVVSYLEKNKYNFKMYYPIPNYEFVNAIFTDDYLPNEESILSRDLYFFDSINENVYFPEREVFKEIVKKDTNLFKEVSNSYLVEIAKKRDFSDVKYVTFGLLRKNPFRIKTVIKDDVVVKSANNEISKSHIDRIKYNIDVLNEYGIDTIDTAVELEDGKQVITSKFIKDSVSLDRKIINLLKDGKKEEALNEIDGFKKNILDKFKVVTKNLNANIFTVFNVDIDAEKIKDLHFVKEGLLDLIFQNCFVIDGKLFPYDQEWLEANTPIEYILYRCIRYLPELKEYFDINEIYERFGIIKFLEEFKVLDEKMQTLLRDDIFWDLHLRSVEKVEALDKKFDLIAEREERIKELEKAVFDKDVHIYNLEKMLSDSSTQISSYQNQLQVISNSLSWKITKPFRYLSWMFSLKSKAPLLDRILPPGGRRRIKYDEKLAKKLWEKKIAGYRAATDEEGVEYWKGIEHRERLLKERSEERKAKGEWSKYEYWMEQNDATEEELERQKKVKFKKRPKISIVIPLYNTPEELFRELLFNLYRQTYTNWELCLADGSKEELEYIKKMCKDERIKYKFLGKNLGISGNSNEGLAMATGDWVALLDHDDLLMQDALYEVVKVINENPNVRFVYTDEDKMTTIDTPRFDAHFKPKFSPDYLRGNNYICHFSVFKKEVMDKLEGFRDDYNGAQDLDIFLRMTEIVEPKDIIHIPKVLYHWRICETSTAGNPEGKLYAYESGRKAVEDHIHRLGLKGTVERDPNMFGIYRVKYDVEENDKASIIISEYLNKDNLERCIESILNITEHKNYDINIVENKDLKDDKEIKDYLKHIEKKDNINVYRNFENAKTNFEKLNNVVSKLKTDYIVFVNGNLKIEEPRWLTDFIGFARRNEIGAVGGKIYNADDTIYFAGRAVTYAGVLDLNKDLNRKYYGYFAKECHIENYSSVSSKLMIVSKEKFDEVGGFDTSLEVLSDVELNLKLLDKGYLNVYNPYDYAYISEDYVEINGYEEKRETESKKIVENRNIVSDPFFSINMEQESKDYLVRTDKVNL